MRDCFEFPILSFNGMGVILGLLARSKSTQQEVFERDATYQGLRVAVEGEQFTIEACSARSGETPPSPCPKPLVFYETGLSF